MGSGGACFVIWTQGASVFTLTPPDGDWRADTWLFAEVPPAAGNAVVPTSPNENGTCSRFRYLPSRKVYLLVNRTGDPLFAYKLGPDDDTPPASPARLAVQ